MSLGSCKDNNHKCKGCACDTLRKLPKNTEVDVFLSSGTTLEDVIFKRLNHRNCCALFKDKITEPCSVIIVDCKQINAIRIEAD